MLPKRKRHNKGSDRSGLCCACGTWRRSLHDDHILPRWQGGDDSPHNFQKLCANCHEDKTAEERATPEYRAFVSVQVKTRMLSQEARDAISAAVKKANAARVWTPEMRQRCYRPGVKRAPFTQQHKDRISAARTGKKLSAEHCAALKASRAGKGWSDVRKAKHMARYPDRYPTGLWPILLS